MISEVTFSNQDSATINLSTRYGTGVGLGMIDITVIDKLGNSAVIHVFVDSKTYTVAENAVKAFNDEMSKL